MCGDSMCLTRRAPERPLDQRGPISSVRRRNAMVWRSGKRFLRVENRTLEDRVKVRKDDKARQLGGMADREVAVVERNMDHVVPQVGLKVAVDLSPGVWIDRGKSLADEIIYGRIIDADPCARGRVEGRQRAVRIAVAAPANMEEDPLLNFAEESIDHAGNVGDLKLNIEANLLEVVGNCFSHLFAARQESGDTPDRHVRSLFGVPEVGQNSL